MGCDQNNDTQGAGQAQQAASRTRCRASSSKQDKVQGKHKVQGKQQRGFIPVFGGSDIVLQMFVDGISVDRILTPWTSNCSAVSLQCSVVLP